MTPEWFEELLQERAGIVADGKKVDQDTGLRIAKQQMGVGDTEPPPEPETQRYTFKF